MRYKVLLVDDEPIIRDGIATVIDWEGHGLELIGTASNGVEALAMIRAEPPRIVITDLKMPVLDGLELIAKAKAEHPEIEFVVLSGYSEFESAKAAMRFGVRHYLLKPCNENKIVQVLLELKSDLARLDQQEEFLRKNRENLEKVLPLVKEQFLRDFITGRSYTKTEYQEYRRLFGLEDQAIRLILFEPEAECGVEELFGLAGIIDTHLAQSQYLNTVLRNQVLTLTGEVSDAELLALIQRVKDQFGAIYHLEISVAYSDSSQFEDTPGVFSEMQECLRHSFYLGAGSVITKKDIDWGDAPVAGGKLHFDFEALALAVKSGNAGAVDAALDLFFNQLHSEKYRISVARSYAAELLMIIIRQSRREQEESDMGAIEALRAMTSLEQIRKSLRTIAARIAKANYEAITTQHDRIIGALTQYVREHLSDERLSLKRLAAEVVFLSESYLSKLFTRVTGENFSHYLMRIRMEKAKELMEKDGNQPVYEIAQQIGLGNNPQYFSQLFRKYTGLTPSEYKKTIE
jgi:two-component system response regulator YesN